MQVALVTNDHDTPRAMARLGSALDRSLVVTPHAPRATPRAGQRARALVTPPPPLWCRRLRVGLPALLRANGRAGGPQLKATSRLRKGWSLRVPPRAIPPRTGGGGGGGGVGGPNPEACRAPSVNTSVGSEQ